MSMPNIPDMNPEINVSRDEAVNVILSSIGMEELSLAHILNAEAEKIQFALGTLEGSCRCPCDINTIMAVNKSSSKVLKDVIKNQMLLSMKLDDAIEIINSDKSFPNPPCPPVYPPAYPPYYYGYPPSPYPSGCTPNPSPCPPGYSPAPSSCPPGCTPNPPPCPPGCTPNPPPYPSDCSCNNGTCFPGKPYQSQQSENGTMNYYDCKK